MIKSILFVLILIPLLTPAFGQSLSELDRQLDELNAKKAQEIQSGGSSSTFSTVDCPIGKIQKAVSGGRIICVDDPNSVSSITLDENSGYYIIGAIILIIIIAVAVKGGGGGSIGVRKSFSSSVKHQVLKKQDHRCNSCRRVLNVVDYDHIDGDRTNNDISNCQALCPNCHAIKSRKAQMGESE